MDPTTPKLEYNGISIKHNFFWQALFKFIINDNFTAVRTKQWRCDINITFKK